MVSGRLVKGTSGVPFGPLGAWASFLAGRELSRECPNTSGDPCAINAPPRAASECRQAISARLQSAPWRFAWLGNDRSFHTSTSSTQYGLPQERSSDLQPANSKTTAGPVQLPTEHNDLQELAAAWRQLSSSVSTAASTAGSYSNGGLANSSGATNSGPYHEASNADGPVTAARTSTATAAAPSASPPSAHMVPEHLLQRTCALLDRRHANLPRALHPPSSTSAAPRQSPNGPHVSAAAEDIRALTHIVSSAASCYAAARPPPDLTRSLVAAATAVAYSAPWPQAAQLLDGLVRLGAIGTRYLEHTVQRIKLIPAQPVASTADTKPWALHYSASSRIRSTSSTSSASSTRIRSPVEPASQPARGADTPPLAVTGGRVAPTIDSAPTALDATSLLRSLSWIHTTKHGGLRGVDAAMNRLMAHLSTHIDTLPAPAPLVPLLDAVTSCGWRHDREPAFLFSIGEYLCGTRPRTGGQHGKQKPGLLTNAGAACGAADGCCGDVGNCCGPPPAARLLALTPAQMTSVLAAFVRAGVKHNGLVSTALGAADRCLPAFTSSQAARLAEVCARFDHFRPSLMRRLALHVGAQLPDAVAPGDVAAVVTALAQCGVREERFLSVVAAYATHHAVALQQQQQQNVQQQADWGGGWAASNGDANLRLEGQRCEESGLQLGGWGRAEGRSGVEGFQGGHGHAEGSPAVHDNAPTACETPCTQVAAAQQSVGARDFPSGSVRADSIAGRQKDVAAVPAASTPSPADTTTHAEGYPSGRPARPKSVLEAARAAVMTLKGPPPVPLEHGDAGRINLQRIATGQDTRTGLLISGLPLSLKPHKLMEELVAASGGRLDMFYMPYDHTAAVSKRGQSGKGFAVASVTTPQAVATVYQWLRSGRLCGMDTVPHVSYTCVSGTNELLQALMSLPRCHGGQVDSGRRGGMWCRPVLLYTSGALAGQVQPLEPSNTLLAWPQQPTPLAQPNLLPDLPPRTADPVVRRLHSGPPAQQPHPPSPSKHTRPVSQPHPPPPAPSQEPKKTSQEQPVNHQPKPSLQALTDPASLTDSHLNPHLEHATLRNPSTCTSSQAAAATARPTHLDARAFSLVRPHHPHTPLLTPSQLAHMAHGMAALGFHHLPFLESLRGLFVDLLAPVGQVPGRAEVLVQALAEQPLPALQSTKATAAGAGGGPAVFKDEEEEAAVVCALTEGRVGVDIWAVRSLGPLESACPCREQLLQRWQQEPPHQSLSHRPVPQSQPPQLPPLKSVLHTLHALLSRPEPDTQSTSALAAVAATAIRAWLPAEAGKAAAAELYANDIAEKGHSGGGGGSGGHGNTPVVDAAPSRRLWPLPHATPSHPPQSTHQTNSGFGLAAPQPPGAALHSPAPPASTPPSPPAVPLPALDIFNLHAKLLAQVLTAASDHGPRLYDPQRPLYAAAAGLLRCYLPHLRPRAACGLLQALVRADYPGSRHLVRAVAPLLTRYPERLSPLALVQLAAACARCCVWEDRTLVNVLAGRTRQLLPALPTAVAAELFWALAVLHHHQHQDELHQDLPDPNAELGVVAGDAAAVVDADRGAIGAGCGGGGGGGGNAVHGRARGVFDGILQLLLDRYDLTARDLLLLQEGIHLRRGGPRWEAAARAREGVASREGSRGRGGLGGSCEVRTETVGAETVGLMDADPVVSEAEVSGMDAFLHELLARKGLTAAALAGACGSSSNELLGGQVPAVRIRSMAAGAEGEGGGEEDESARAGSCRLFAGSSSSSKGEEDINSQSTRPGEGNVRQVVNWAQSGLAAGDGGQQHKAGDSEVVRCGASLGGGFEAASSQAECVIGSVMGSATTSQSVGRRTTGDARPVAAVLAALRTGDRTAPGCPGPAAPPSASVRSPAAADIAHAAALRTAADPAALADPPAEAGAGEASGEADRGSGRHSGDAAAALAVQGLLEEIGVARRGLVVEEAGGLLMRLRLSGEGEARAHASCGGATGTK